MNDLGQGATLLQKATKTDAVKRAFFLRYYDRCLAVGTASQRSGQVFLERHLLPGRADRPVNDAKTARTDLLDYAITTHRFSRCQGCGGRLCLSLGHAIVGKFYWPATDVP